MTKVQSAQDRKFREMFTRKMYSIHYSLKDIKASQNYSWDQQEVGEGMLQSKILLYTTKTDDQVLKNGYLQKTFKRWG